MKSIEFKITETMLRVAAWGFWKNSAPRRKNLYRYLYRACEQRSGNDHLMMSQLVVRLRAVYDKINEPEPEAILDSPPFRSTAWLELSYTEILSNSSRRVISCNFLYDVAMQKIANRILSAVEKWLKISILHLLHSTNFYCDQKLPFSAQLLQRLSTQ